MASKSKRPKDPLDPQDVLRNCRWPITTRGTRNQKIVNPCNMVYDSRENSHQLLHAVMAIVRIIKVVLPLAAASQTKRCTQCKAVPLPWHRIAFCENCVPRDHGDRQSIQTLERKAQAICGLKAPRYWSITTKIL